MPRKPIDDGKKQPCHHGLGAPDAQLTRARIGQRLEFAHAAPQVVGKSDAALEQCLAVEGGLDTMTAPVKKPNAECLFEIGDHLRYDGLRDREMFGRSRHAAPLNNRNENVQLPQFDTSTDLRGVQHVF